MNYGKLEKEVIELEKKLKKYEKSERTLDHEMHDLKNEVKHVEFVEDDLLKKESKLEEKMKHESWGEKEGEGHHIDMKPLIPHISQDEIEDDVKHVFHTIKDKMEDLRHNFFGDNHRKKHHFSLFDDDWFKWWTVYSQYVV